ncbi:hypothetical protein B0H14DRAFT_2610107 [Mycena olivaceomarginata]|nr:hypothetical protein B0H14DRAFT_2610107 [Mycena olivaceomarginata]
MRGLPLDDAPKIQCRLRLVSGLIALSVIGILLFSPDPRSFNRTAARDFQRLPISCPIQHSALSPGISFSLRHKERGAVQLRTETFDGAPQDGNNPWYDKFYEFEAYLLETLPDVFTTLKLEHFATHALLLTWQGNNDSLPPIVLMAHQDTVPVPFPEETVERWTHPPIAELSAVSELTAAGFSPKRTVILSFGFDEEGGGVLTPDFLSLLKHSARAAAQHGRDSIFATIDEGGGVIEDYFGQTWVLPAAVSFLHFHWRAQHQPTSMDGKGEKCSVNIKVSVNIPGGHSSILLPHTTIDILSTLVAAIEMHQSPVTALCIIDDSQHVLKNKNNFERLELGTPARGTETVGLRVAVTAVKRHKKTVVSPHGPHGSLPCRVRAACESLMSSTARLPIHQLPCMLYYRMIDDELKDVLGCERTWSAAVGILSERSAGDAARLSTTQASCRVIPLAKGVKVNTLPEEAHGIVNHRVAVEDLISRQLSIGEACMIQERYVKLLTPDAAKFNLSVVGFGDEPPVGVMRYLRLDTADASPVMPTTGDTWRVLTGPLLYLWPEAIVALYLRRFRTHLENQKSKGVHIGVCACDTSEPVPNPSMTKNSYSAIYGLFQHWKL